MKKLLLVAALLALSGSLLASNMGFKLSKPLANDGLVKANWVSLPSFYQPADNNANGKVDAQDVCEDIGGPCLDFMGCTIGHWVEATDTDEFWFCGDFTEPFELKNPDGTIDMAIYAMVSTPTSWTIVGSHNPVNTYNLTNGGLVKANWVSIPYHKTAANAQQLCEDIGGPCLDFMGCTIGHWIQTSDTDEFWFCGDFTEPFALTAGDGVYVMVSTPVAAYTPSHY